MDHSKFRRTYSTVRIHSGTRLAKIQGVRLGEDGEKIYSVLTRIRAGRPWSKTPHEVPVGAFLGGDPMWEVEG